ncbi:alpha/beta fold hydrolase [Saccharopolyspora gregorii]|uniref:alpha/beta fold hydrolase n=1 Tax=Saccharopolyspora gregorii TaxID=33914 RepID=UPI0031F03B3F
MRAVLRRLAEHGAVLAVDFRGHGRLRRSQLGRPRRGRGHVGGAGTAPRARHRRVVSVGFSLGGAVALRQAALADPVERPDAMISVSGPARWWGVRTPGDAAVHWLLEQPHGRWAARLLGVRLGEEWGGGPGLADRTGTLLAPTRRCWCTAPTTTTSRCPTRRPCTRRPAASCGWSGACGTRRARPPRSCGPDGALGPHRRRAVRRARLSGRSGGCCPGHLSASGARVRR